MLPIAQASHSRQVEALREGLLAALAGITPRAGNRPDAVHRRRGLDRPATLGPEYWYRNLRHRALPGRRAAPARRRTLDVRRGQPAPTLTLGIEDTAVDAGPPTPLSWTPCAATTAGRAGCCSPWPKRRSTACRWTGRRSSPGPGRAGSSCPPTPSSGSATGWTPPAAGDPLGVGQHEGGHPLLGAAVELPGGAGTVFTGRLSLTDHHG
ncbi:hypothetical protein GXW82_04940 [Streptacidiphilus sp. 4-A2]|nr:hypothetical protein [Streptacidiphilus sp. 4-A2]